MSVRVALVADGSQRAGLGHLSRSTAIGHALGELGAVIECRALGAGETILRDELPWHPLDTLAPIAGRVADYDAVVLDGYELDPDLVAAVGTGAPVAWFDDDGDVPPQVALAIAPARVVPPGRDDPGVLAGLEHAPLGRRFWDPPHRETLPELARVLVTMGGTDARNKSAELAAVARDAAPSAEIALVRGPNSEPGPAPGGVSVIGPLPGLGDELAQSDLMIGAAGQTMLEAAALGTPALVAVAAPNQAAGARELELRGAVSLFDIDAPEDLRTRIAAMGDVERRRRMSAAGQEAVDGSGARRIARAVVALAAGDG